MNAISLYVSASRLLFNQSDIENPNYSDLYRLVPYLRQSLSCTVCASLLVEPFSPDVCQHHVCRNCIGGRKNLKPTCSSCKNYHNYHANTQLRILLQCYKISNGNNEAQNLAELIDEGAQFHDEYKSNSGLPRSKISILPCIFTTTSSSSSQSNSSTILVNKPAFTAQGSNTSYIHATSNQPVCVTSIQQSTSRPNESVAVVPNPTLTKTAPIKTVTNGTALYSVLYTGAGNKITIKRKTDDNLFTTTNTMSTKDVLNILNRNPAKIVHHSQIQQFQVQKPFKTIAHIPQQLNQAQPVTGLVATNTQNFKKPTLTLKTNKVIQKRKGCRCGNATPTPGKLTCCGQRCPCYVESKSCIDCKCRGCRNPHRIDGLKVCPQLPQLTCLVQMNNQSFEKGYIDVPISSINSTNSCTEAKIKQEIIPISGILPGSSNTQLDLTRRNKPIEYISNDLDDDNIQVVNVYTTHMPEISSTLPTIIMQDEASALNSSTQTAGMTLHNHLSLPSESYSLIGEDLIKHSFSDESSSGDQSDVEIDQ